MIARPMRNLVEIAEENVLDFWYVAINKDVVDYFCEDQSQYFPFS